MRVTEEPHLSLTRLIQSRNSRKCHWLRRFDMRKTAGSQGERYPGHLGRKNVRRARTNQQDLKVSFSVLIAFSVQSFVEITPYMNTSPLCYFTVLCFNKVNKMGTYFHHDYILYFGVIPEICMILSSASDLTSVIHKSLKNSALLNIQEGV